jgi:NADPH2:quinone reductase
MMRAAVYDRTGTAAEVLTLRRLQRPEPGPGEVLVRVRASGINPADTKRRAGWNGATMGHPLVIPHCDGAGEIAQVGAGVDAARIGQRVWLYNAQGGYGSAGRAFGTAAEFVALPAAQAVPLPGGLSFEEGACLGVPGLTAWLAVLGDGPVDDRTVLIQGVAGAVGHMCAQVALAQGARVLGTVSDDAGAAHAATAGDVTVLPRGDGLAGRVRAASGGRGADRIIEVDLAANLAADIACLAPQGTIASYSSTSDPKPTLPYYALADLGATIRFIQGFLLRPDQRAAAETMIADLAASGRLRPVIGATFPLDRIAGAHARVESRALGQTVVTLDP